MFGLHCIYVLLYFCWQLQSRCVLFWSCGVRGSNPRDTWSVPRRRTSTCRYVSQSLIGRSTEIPNKHICAVFRQHCICTSWLCRESRPRQHEGSVGRCRWVVRRWRWEFHGQCLGCKPVFCPTSAQWATGEVSVVMWSQYLLVLRTAWTLLFPRWSVSLSRKVWNVGNYVCYQDYCCCYCCHYWYYY